MAFGPDGYLYIAVGDGGSGGDPLGHGQNTSTLLGNILRIDVDNPAGGLNYGIPADNPFVNDPGNARKEIFAYGLRNPWRMSFDTSTGSLWVADVGQDVLEEIDIVENGGNYGWKIMEGSNCFEISDCDKTDLIEPYFEYVHENGNSLLPVVMSTAEQSMSLMDGMFMQIICLAGFGHLNQTQVAHPTWSCSTLVLDSPPLGQIMTRIYTSAPLMVRC